MKVKAAEMSGEAVDNKTKLDIIKHEEAIIAAEKEQKEREAKVGGRGKDIPVDHIEMSMTPDSHDAVEMELIKKRREVGYLVRRLYDCFYNPQRTLQERATDRQATTYSWYKYY